MAQQAPVTVYGIAFEAYIQIVRVRYDRHGWFGQPKDEVLEVRYRLWHEPTATYAVEESIQIDPALVPAVPGLSAMDAIKSYAYGVIARKYPGAKV